MIFGSGVSKGTVISKIFIIKEESINFENESKVSKEEEKIRYEQCMSKFIIDSKNLIEKISLNASDTEAGIIEGHIEMSQDPEIVDGVIEGIESGLTSEAAVENVFSMFKSMFESLDDDLIKSRATDLEDIKINLIKILTNTNTKFIDKLKGESVVVKNDFTPSDTGQIDKNLVKGILAEVGGMTAHTAIIARAMEIPAVLGVTNITKIAEDGDTVIINGKTGEVILNPSNEQIENAKNQIKLEKQEKEELEKYKTIKATTLDGHHVELFANIGGNKEVAKVNENGADGIGLFRTELIFMDTTTSPTEEEQFEIYKKVVVDMNGKPVIIRTLDIGGDKDVPYLKFDKEDNPFLGLRAIRLCLAKKELFEPQILALLRASAFGDIKIMIPMVSTTQELREANKFISLCKEKLDKKNISYNKNIEVGIMIETPAASLIADLLAKECDFFSIGTNDLTQYTLAVDRGNVSVSYLYNTFDPAVIRSIYNTVKCAKEEGIMVGMCGEAAGDELMIPFLLAIGLDEFSLNASNILQTKKIISKYSLKELQVKIPKILELSTSEEVKNFLKDL
jgi:phosphoenolpyruvate-protein phosphotransferase (PTS system enzyme I)